MEVSVDWMQIVTYVLGAVGAWFLGQPAVKKLWDMLQSFQKPELPDIFAGDEDEEPAADEVDTAADLLEAAFYFKDLGNQAGVEKCLEAIAELTHVPEIPIRELVQE